MSAVGMNGPGLDATQVPLRTRNGLDGPQVDFHEIVQRCFVRPRITSFGYATETCGDHGGLPRAFIVQSA